MIDWKSAAETPVDEQTGFEELPAGAWCVGATATLENGGASPTMKLKSFNDTDRGRVQYYAFNVGLLVKGGDSVLDPNKHKDRYMFFSSSVHPRDDDEGTAAKSLLHGKVVGFLNAMFAPGVALDEKDKKVRAGLRWRITLSKLAEVEKAHPEIGGDSAINEITGLADTGLAIMQLAIAGIENDSKLVLFKTGLSKKRAGYEQRVEVKQFEDAVAQNYKERKVQLFDAMGVVVPAAAVPGF
jgi:hypothetical protein